MNAMIKSQMVTKVDRQEREAILGTTPSWEKGHRLCQGRRKRLGLWEVGTPPQPRMNASAEIPGRLGCEWGLSSP